MVVVVEFFGFSDADGYRKTLAERATGYTDARKTFDRSRVPLKTRSQATEGGELGHREVTAASEDAIQHRADVTVRKEEHVLTCPIHLEMLRVDLHLVEIQGRHDIGGTERAARMSRLTTMNHSDNITSDLRRNIF